MSATEARDYGLIDSIILTREDESARPVGLRPRPDEPEANAS